MPCEVGGCWSCAVEVNQELKPTCVTPVKESLRIRTRLPKDFIPKRIVHGFSGHSVGGVGTPWWIKRNYGYIEAACFAAAGLCSLIVDGAPRAAPGSCPAAGIVSGAAIVGASPSSSPPRRLITTVLGVALGAPSPMMPSREILLVLAATSAIAPGPGESGHHVPR